MKQFVIVSKILINSKKLCFSSNLLNPVILQKNASCYLKIMGNSFLGFVLKNIFLRMKLEKMEGYDPLKVLKMRINNSNLSFAFENGF